MSRPRAVPDNPTTACPCGLGLPYAECCGRYHRGEAGAPTAEALMRSRFTAYVTRDSAYLLRTWHPTTRPRVLRLGAEPRFTRLEILGTRGGGLFDTGGTVLFEAHYLDAGRPGRLRENSRFTRTAGEWLYLGPDPAER